MNITILTKLPIWFLFFCLLLAVAYSLVLYRRDRRFGELAKVKLYAMAAFRFLSVFLISFLLLSPMVRSITKDVQKPLLLFAQDNSESVVINKDSVLYKTTYPEAVAKMFEQLSEKFDIEVFSYGETITDTLPFDYTQKYTDISQLFDFVENNYVNRNVGAVIVAGDGIYNHGTNPVYAARNAIYPVYTVAMGDTGKYLDISIQQIKSNKIAFLGNLTPLRVNVAMKSLKGEQTKMTVVHKGNAIFEKLITATTDNYTEDVDVSIEVTSIGLQQFVVNLEPAEGEINKANNHATVLIDVIDSKQKVLILANAPHPDIGAIQKSLSAHQNYDVEYYTADQFTKTSDIDKYNLVILHQIPSAGRNTVQLMAALLKADVPIMFIAGAQTDFRQLNNLKAGLTIDQKKGAFDNSNAKTNDKFTLFELSEPVKQLAEFSPPMITPFGDYTLNASADVLFYQSIKGITTTLPLIAFDKMGERKIAFVVGDGLWRWRLNDYLENSNHEAFNELVNKTVQYLALKVHKDKFVVNAARAFAENESVHLQAEVYNDSYELITDAEVSLQITTTDNKTFNFVFDVDKISTKTYAVNCGVLPVGEYSYEATMKLNQQTEVRKGTFVVMPIQEEARVTQADHHLLYLLASQSGGKQYLPDQLAELAEALNNNTDIVSVANISKNLQDMINLKWLLAIIITLLAAEWFMRKFYGGY